MQRLPCILAAVACLAFSVSFGQTRADSVAAEIGALQKSRSQVAERAAALQAALARKEALNQKLDSAFQHNLFLLDSLTGVMNNGKKVSKPTAAQRRKQDGLRLRSERLKKHLTALMSDIETLKASREQSQELLGKATSLLAALDEKIARLKRR